MSSSLLLLLFDYDYFVSSMLCYSDGCELVDEFYGCCQSSKHIVHLVYDNRRSRIAPVGSTFS